MTRGSLNVSVVFSGTLNVNFSFDWSGVKPLWHFCTTCELWLGLNQTPRDENAVSASTRPFTNHGADTVSISGSNTDLVDGHLCKRGGSQMRKTSCAWFDSIWRSRWQCQMLHRKIVCLRIKHWAFPFQQSGNWKGIHPHVEAELGLKHTIEPWWYTTKQRGC